LQDYSVKPFLLSQKSLGKNRPSAKAFCYRKKALGKTGLRQKPFAVAKALGKRKPSAKSALAFFFFAFS